MSAAPGLEDESDENDESVSAIPHDIRRRLAVMRMLD
jgi:hypothetical protein